MRAMDVRGDIVSSGDRVTPVTLLDGVRASAVRREGSCKGVMSMPTVTDVCEG